MGEIRHFRENGLLLTIRLGFGRYESSCSDRKCVSLLNRAANQVPWRFGAGNCSFVVMQVDSVVADMLLANSNHSLLLTQWLIPEMVHRIAVEGIDNSSDIHRTKLK